MRRFLPIILLGLGLAAQASEATAAACAAGVYRAGCVGPNGAVVTNRPAAHPYRSAPVTCAAGAYRAGCVGPNGAVVSRPRVEPHCYWSRGVKVCR